MPESLSSSCALEFPAETWRSLGAVVQSILTSVEPREG